MDHDRSIGLYLGGKRTFPKGPSPGAALLLILSCLEASRLPGLGTIARHVDAHNVPTPTGVRPSRCLDQDGIPGFGSLGALLLRLGKNNAGNSRLNTQFHHGRNLGKVNLLGIPDTRWQDFVVESSLPWSFGFFLAQFNLLNPLDIANGCISWNNDSQWISMISWKWLSIHFITHNNIPIRIHSLFNTNRSHHAVHGMESNMFQFSIFLGIEFIFQSHVFDQVAQSDSSPLGSGNGTLSPTGTRSTFKVIVSTPTVATALEGSRYFDFGHTLNFFQTDRFLLATIGSKIKFQLKIFHIVLGQKRNWMMVPNIKQIGRCQVVLGEQMFWNFGIHGLFPMHNEGWMALFQRFQSIGVSSRFLQEFHLEIHLFLILVEQFANEHLFHEFHGQVRGKVLTVDVPKGFHRRSCRLHNLFGTTWVIGNKVGNVIDIATIGHPNRCAVCSIIHGNLFCCIHRRLGFCGSRSDLNVTATGCSDGFAGCGRRA
mmetsp:Transcript_44211/g.106533  ORF Transcript_44211/g.106533 Transcript_44211/m.106533 type:complete len:484 (+) Transcript_44211:308-1759(+)